jgi:SOS-response transcriptional repressor LexA
MSKISDNLRYYLARSGLSQAELAARSGCSQGAINKILQGKSEKTRFLAEIAKALDVSADALAGIGAGVSAASIGAVPPVTVEGDAKPFDQNVQRATGPVRQVPLISSVTAGKLTEICDPYALGAYERLVMVHEDVSARAFALRIVGDSMLPEFREGDIIIVDPDVTPQPGDYVVAKNHSEEATFKRYRPRGMNESGKEYFELVPLNQDFPTLRSDFQNLVIIGVEVEHHSLRRNRKR